MPSGLCGLQKNVVDFLLEEKNIKELYDWQTECLNLPCINQRKNLIYCVSTSGGKTLVAEILILKEILVNKKNAIFILPFVAIVQEKVNSLSSLAVKFHFLVEEYAGSKGKYPPPKRRNKNSVFVCTIEKAVGLINSIIEEKRLNEFGIAVIDELHLIGEPNRGSLLENVIIKLMLSSVYIIAMSATIGNLNDVALFLKASKFIRSFRPTELKEYVIIENEKFQVNYHQDPPITYCDRIAPEIDPDIENIDPDRIGFLVKQVIPVKSCLVFCPTKKNCENVSLLICKTMKKNKDYLDFKRIQRKQLLKALSFEGNGLVCPVLLKTIPYGISYHHSGLTSSERKLIEEAYAQGTICCICCTSTLAAGVNLPAQRVIIRAPYIGHGFISLSRYKQMIGRAGRAGLEDKGESILICKPMDAPKVSEMVWSGIDICNSQLHGKELINFILSVVSLKLANTVDSIIKIFDHSFLKICSTHLNINIDLEVKSIIEKLIVEGVFVRQENDNNISLSVFGKAMTKGNISYDIAEELIFDLKNAQNHLVLLNDLHLLYLVTPYSAIDNIRLSCDELMSVYSNLRMEEIAVAKVIGISEWHLNQIMTGNVPKSISKRKINRFYIALVLNKLWCGANIWDVSNQFNIDRGFVNNLLLSTSSFAYSIIKFCEEMNNMRCFVNILSPFPDKLNYCCCAELVALMELPAVKLGRARQLYNKGFKTLEIIAKTEPRQLTECIEHLPLRQAKQIVSVAKLQLITKYDSLHEEAARLLESIA